MSLSIATGALYHAVLSPGPDAVLQRDYSIIQGVTLLSSAVYVVVNLLVDLCYLLLDPRIRY